MAENSNPEPHIFFVDTRFQRMARRPGGIPREQAIERAQSQVDELKPGFPAWLDRELQNFIAAIRQLETDPTDMTQLETAYHSCCQLRDVGTTMGFVLITFISNILCEHLDAFKTGAPYHKETIDCHIDALILASKAPYCNLHPDQLPEMTGGLRQVVERAKNSTAE